MGASLLAKLRTEGRAWLRSAIDTNDLEELRDLGGPSGRPGRRATSTSPLFEAIQNLPALKAVTTEHPGLRPVRVVRFNKSDGTNWGVPWHQDRIIAVRNRAEISGFENWSRKGEIWHCEPPLDLLARMLFLRVHLDAQTENNGAMEIAVHSHIAGFCLQQEAEHRAKNHLVEVTRADAGDILVLPMLTLHRSKAAQTPAPRS